MLYLNGVFNRALEAAALTLKVFGVIYAIVAALGLAAGDTMLLGIILMNHADHWLHVALAIVILAAGFLLPDDHRA
jgi:hypothetical protein